MRAQSQSGYSLLEAAIVLAVIMVVSSVALPAVLPALRAGGYAQARGELHAGLSRARASALRSGARAAFSLDDVTLSSREDVTVGAAPAGMPAVPGAAALPGREISFRPDATLAARCEAVEEVGGAWMRIDAPRAIVKRDGPRAASLAQGSSSQARASGS